MAKGITSLTGFVRKIESLRNDLPGTLYFRGHESDKFNIVPSVFRNSQLRRNENRLIDHFRSEVPELFSGDSRTIEYLVRSQHFGLPTRLLDVSQNPLIALFFSCWKQPKATGQVVIFEVPKGTERFTESDTISCVANLSKLTSAERRDLASFGLALAGEYRDAGKSMYGEKEEFIEDFNRSPICARLVQFVREEKPYFEPRIWFDDLIDTHAVIPRKSNQRIVAQSGAFLIFGLYEEFEKAFAREIKVHRININSNHKGSILDALSAIGINEYSVFPEPEKIASTIRKLYS